MKKKVAIILLASFLLSGCSSKQTESFATIQDLYGEEAVTATDTAGNTIISTSASRKLTDVHPELPAYDSKFSYENTYLPLYDMCLDTERFTLKYSDGACMIIQDQKNPTAGYTLLNITEYTPYASDEDVAKAVMPYAKVYNASDDAIHDILIFDGSSMQQDQINRRVGTGMRLNLICSDTYIPEYAYGVYVRQDNISKGIFMTTDNTVTKDGGSRVIGEPNESIVLDTKTNKGSETIAAALLDKPDVTYAVYSGKTSIAVPSFMQIQSENDGLYVSDKEGEISSLTRCGMILLYDSTSYSINDYVEKLKEDVAEIYGCTDSMKKIATSDIKYEEGVDFLGVSDAKHIYGVLTAKDRTSNITTTMPGNGYFKFDIYVVSKGGTQYTTMFYYSAAQEKEMKEWIALNCY